jgi:hypothetical protein
MALEEYIKQVKEVWTSYTLDLVNYQNKCRLIKYVIFGGNLSASLMLVVEDGMTFLTSVARI